MWRTELKYAYPEGVPFQITDKREEDYGRAAEVGGGGGSNIHSWAQHKEKERNGGGTAAERQAAFLKRLPETVIKNGKVISIRSDIAEQVGGGGQAEQGPRVVQIETEAGRAAASAAAGGDCLASPGRDGSSGSGSGGGGPLDGGGVGVTSLQLKSSDGRAV